MTTLKSRHARRYAPKFDSDFAGSGLTRYFNTHHPEHITIVDDPVLGASRKVARFQTLNTDILPTANPRTQVESPYNIAEGNEAWLGFALLFPAGFPLPYPNGWINFCELYGPPFNGSPPWGIGMNPGTSQVKLARNDGSPIAWRLEATTGLWMDFAFRTRQASHTRQGFLEIWLNVGAGWTQQSFADGTTRFYFPTIDASNNSGGNSWIIQNYRQVDTADDVTVYFAAHRLGRSLAEVDAHSHG